MIKLPGSHILSYKGQKPSLGEGVFLASGCHIIGDVIAGAQCSFWFNTVIRGDCNYIRIGNRVNIQDGSVIHVTNKLFPTFIEDNVSVGHGAVIHGCRIGRGSLIGMGAQILDGAEVGEGSLVAAGALVPPGKSLPGGYVHMGSPAKPIRPLRPDEQKLLEKTVEYYLDYKESYRDTVEIEH